MTVKRRPRRIARPARGWERRRKPRGAEPGPEPPEIPRGLARRAEELMEDEDDFADGRSSAGRRMRAEEDAWGRNLEPGERPFEEEDVPPRDGRAPRSEPEPEPEEPASEEGGEEKREG